MLTNVSKFQIMDPSANQLIEAPEDDDIDDLNDETFGDSAENCK
jgi:hypothetical protein